MPNKEWIAKWVTALEASALRSSLVEADRQIGHSMPPTFMYSHKDLMIREVALAKWTAGQ